MKALILVSNGYYAFESLNGSLILCNSRCMVVGFHPLVVCDENKEQMEAHKFYESLHHIFVRFGVVSIGLLFFMFLGVVLLELNFCICISLECNSKTDY